MHTIVKDLMDQGHADEDITRALISAGWRPRAAQSALRGWHRTPLGAVPRPNTRVRDMLHGLGLLSLLGSVSVQAGHLAFALISFWIPDPAAIAPHTLPHLSWPVANLIVLAPVLIFVMRRWPEIPIWVNLCTRGLVALILIGDAIAITHGLLRGEATLAFLLKCGVVLVLALLVLLTVRERRDA